MSVIIFTEIDNGVLKKSSLEAVYYGAEVAKMKGTTATILAIGTATDDELAKAGNYGATKVLHANDARLATDNIQAYSDVLASASALTACVLRLRDSSARKASATKFCSRS